MSIDYTLQPGAIVIKSPKKERKRSISLDIKSGRMNEYDPDYHDALAASFSRRGMSPREIATKLGVSLYKMKQWYELSQSFRDAVDEGIDYCVAKVEDAMLRRACGYIVKETVHIVGSSATKGPYEETRETTKIVPPDTNAGKFYLQNKRPDLWGEKEQPDNTINIHWEEIRTEVVNNTDEIRQLMGNKEILDAEIIEEEQ